VANAPVSLEQGREAFAAVEKHGTKEKAAEALGISASALGNRLRRAEALYGEALMSGVAAFHADPEVDADADVDDIRARRFREFRRKSAKASADRQINIRLDSVGSFGLTVFGDTHWDDPGSDLELFEEHMNCVLSTEAMYGGHIGDCLNNWVGRLERLHAEASVTPTEGWKLAEHYLKALSPKLLFLSGGNHDAWSGARDPLRYICRGTEIVYRSHRTRVRLLQGTAECLTVNARHKFRGRSIYNAAHGALRELLFGSRDDIAICGHYHVSGLSLTKCPETGRTLRGCLVASYKKVDDFAEQHGFSDQSISPAVAFTCDVSKSREHPDRVQVWWDPLEAAEYLRYLRSR